MSQTAEIIEREAARLLVIDRCDRILLLWFRDPDERPPIWITPGGGLDPGESYENAARREAREEVGLRNFALGPAVWRREHTFTWAGRWYHQRERFYLVRVDEHDVDVSGMEEHEVLLEPRWWSLADIQQAPVEFAPRRLAHFLAPLLKGELTSGLIDVGV